MNNKKQNCSPLHQRVGIGSVGSNCRKTDFWVSVSRNFLIVRAVQSAIGRIGRPVEVLGSYLLGIIESSIAVLELNRELNWMISRFPLCPSIMLNFSCTPFDPSTPQIIYFCLLLFFFG